MNSEGNQNYRKLFLLSVGVIIVMWIMSGYVWITGSGDENGRSFLGIFAVPILMGVILGLLPWFARIEPRQTHLAQSHKALTAIWIVLLLFFFIKQTVMPLDILGREPTITNYWPILAGLVSIVMGNYLGKIRSNTIAGFRTPWTLASELSWNKTHRLGGRLLFLLGLVLILGPLLVTGDFWAYFIIVASFLWVIVLAIYSYTTWKCDPGHSKPTLTG